MKSTLTLFTRPTWQDCQAAKEFLSQKNVQYVEVDLVKDPDREKELIHLTGTRIVPTFLFVKKKWYGRTKKKHLIGFEINQDEIKNIVENNLL